MAEHDGDGRFHSRGGYTGLGSEGGGPSSWAGRSQGSARAPRCRRQVKTITRIRNPGGGQAGAAPGVPARIGASPGSQGWKFVPSGEGSRGGRWAGCDKDLKVFHEKPKPGEGPRRPLSDTPRTSQDARELKWSRRLQGGKPEPARGGNGGLSAAGGTPTGDRRRGPPSRQHLPLALLPRQQDGRRMLTAEPSLKQSAGARETLLSPPTHRPWDLEGSHLRGQGVSWETASSLSGVSLPARDHVA